MNDYFYESIKPVSDELSDLMDYEIPYLPVNRSGEYFPVDTCAHPDDALFYVHKHIESKNGKPFLVQAPWCDVCQSYVSELD